MRLERIMRAVYDEPWLILPRSHGNIRKLLELKLKLDPTEFVMRDREGEGISGSKVELPSMVIDEGVAFIPFGGVLIKGASALEKGSGALAHEDVMADIEEALDDPEVEAMFFDTDSPGGMAMGTPELAEMIADAAQRKPSLCWVEGLCASAAYFSLSGCSLLYGAKSCEVGGVECYMAWIDSRGWFENNGLRVEIIKPEESTYAGAGYPGTKLSAEQRDYLREQCEYLLKMYVAHLGEVRPDIEEESMRGQTFIGEEGVDAGFLDAVATKAEALNELRTLADLPDLGYSKHAQV